MDVRPKVSVESFAGLVSLKTKQVVALKQPLLKATHLNGDLCQQGDQIAHNRFVVIAKAGCGGFGEVYVVKDKTRDVMSALKAEKKVPLHHSQLPLELYVLKLYQNSEHAPKLVFAGAEAKFNYIVMQLLGANLNHLRRCCPLEKHKRFSSSTMLRISVQMIQALRDLHDCGCLHRDQKPSNYAMGYFTTTKKDTVYLLDFGLSRVFVDLDGKPRPRRTKPCCFRGTTRFCALAAHKREDTGRLHDLQSFFYVLYDLWIGALPWAVTGVELDIKSEKIANPQESMAKKLPSSGRMIQFVAHINSLGFADRPNYDLLINLLEETITELKINKNDPWDWDSRFKCLYAEKNITPPLAKELKKADVLPAKLKTPAKIASKVKS